MARSHADAALEKIAALEANLPPGTKVKIQPVLEALERAKQRATGATVEVGPGKPLLYGEKGKVISRGPGTKKAIGNEAAIANYSKLEEQIKAVGDQASYSTLKKIRQVWDREVAEAGGFPGGSLKERSMLNSKREATNSIRRELAKDHPSIAKVNAEYSLWKNVDEILQETILRTEGHVGLLKHISGAGFGAGGLATGALVTGTTGGAVGGAVVASTLAKGLKAMFQSPRWKMISAVKKQKLADALASGQDGENSKGRRSDSRRGKGFLIFPWHRLMLNLRVYKGTDEKTWTQAAERTPGGFCDSIRRARLPKRP